MGMIAATVVVLIAAIVASGIWAPPPSTLFR
jgi:hypothetical protein